jgi:regulator of sirC expression with transglutaminase-like and TPR domain
MRPRDNSLPSAETIRAVVSLLSDPNQGIVEVCQNKLVEWGGASAAGLREAVMDDNPRLRLRSRRILRSISLKAWLDSLTDYASFSGGVPSDPFSDHKMLEDGVFLLSSLGRPADCETTRLVLDQLGNELHARIRGQSAASSARVLRQFLAVENGYGGGCSSYYDEQNVHLDMVSSGHRGIPITLSILYLLVGRRAGMRLSGVEMPDHFLIRVHGTRPVLVDPFHGGRTITRADCARYLRTMGYSCSTSPFLEDMDDRQILISLLGNLQRVFGYREDRETIEIIEQARASLIGP